MAFIDSTVVNVALPAIQRALDGTLAEMQWVVEAYALFLAALLLTGGSLGDLVEPPQGLRHRSDSLFGRVGLVRKRRHRETVDHRSWTPRRGCGAAGPGKSRADHDLISGSRARTGDRNLVGIYLDYSGDRAGAGRLVRGARVVALGILSEPAHRARGAGDYGVARAGDAPAERSDAEVDWLGSVLATAGLGGTV